MIPEMNRQDYRPGLAASIVASSVITGPIVPPSIAIVYGVMTGVSIGSLFIAGRLPDLLLAVALLTPFIVLEPDGRADAVGRGVAPHRQCNRRGVLRGQTRQPFARRLHRPSVDPRVLSPNQHDPTAGAPLSRREPMKAA